MPPVAALLLPPRPAFEPGNQGVLQGRAVVALPGRWRTKAPAPGNFQKQSPAEYAAIWGSLLLSSCPIPALSLYVVFIQPSLTPERDTLAGILRAGLSSQ